MSKQLLPLCSQCRVRRVVYAGALYCGAACAVEAEMYRPRVEEVEARATGPLPSPSAAEPRLSFPDEPGNAASAKPAESAARAEAAKFDGTGFIVEELLSLFPDEPGNAETAKPERSESNE